MSDYASKKKNSMALVLITCFAVAAFSLVGPAARAGIPGSADGTGAAAQFKFPRGVAVDGAGNVYVADSGNHTIRKITPAGVVSTLAGAAGQMGSADGTTTSSRFNWPCAIAVDTSGNLYVADSANHTIRKITAAGVVSTLAGSPGAVGSSDGTGGGARFSFGFPHDISVDSAGNVYVSDVANQTIRKVTAAGVVSTLVGSVGISGSADGTGSEARFYYPYGVAVDSAGNLFVGDDCNETIRKVTPSRVVTTLAGSAGIAGSLDASGSAARFNGPGGTAVDTSGNVYVADQNNNTIRKVTSVGVVTTLAGSAGVSGSADGTGIAARFNQPADVAVDSSGNVYVADCSNHTIRKITPSGVVSTLAGGGSPTSAGQVLAWGYNDYGQCTVPTAAQSGVSAIAAYAFHTVALKNGQVLAWGFNDYGQCTVPVEAQSGVSAIAASIFHTVALKNGQVLAWGYDGWGQCTVPVEAQSGVSAIAAGSMHTVALKNGQVLAWGFNDYGQCTVPVEAQSGVSAIAAGGNHTVALKNGQVLAWGYNGWGQCTVPVEAQSGVSAIAAGLRHTVALKNGQVLAWGQNDYGQCTVPTAAQSGVSAIAAGEMHTVALKNGQVLAWGQNDYGQCTVPTAAQSGVSAIAAGSKHTVALAALSPGSVQLSSSIYSVNENGGTVTITATRTGGSSGAASVNYATANGTATAGLDYTTKSGTLNWADSDVANKTFTVAILDDAVYEGNKTFMVNLSSASGTSLGTLSSATVTIVENDPPPNPLISGRVTRSDNGAGLDGVTLTFSNGGGSTTTSGGGNYSRQVTYGWSGTATPSYGSGSFSRPSKSYAGPVTSDRGSQNYRWYPPGSSIPTSLSWLLLLLGQ